MARFVYREETVKNSINRLEQAYAALSQTEAALNAGFDYLQQVQGGAYIDVGENRKIICEFPENGRNYINELKKAIESKCAEIQDYNNSPWYKKLFATVGMGLAKFGEGFIAAFENMGDACISLIGFGCGIVDCFAGTHSQDIMADAIKFDVAGSIMSNFYTDKTGVGQFVNKYSAMGANSGLANVIKGFGTATGYIVIGKMAGGIARSTKIVNIGETGINSVVAGVGGLGSGTETSLLQGKTFDESLFQGVKKGVIQGSMAYAAGRIGDKIKNDHFNKLKDERDELAKQYEKLQSQHNPSVETVSEMKRIEQEMTNLDGKISSIAKQNKKIDTQKEKEFDASGDAGQIMAKETKDSATGNVKQKTALDLDKVTAKNMTTEGLKETNKEIIKNLSNYGDYSDIATGAAANAGNYANNISKAYNFGIKITEKAATNAPALLQTSTETLQAISNVKENTAAKIEVQERVASLSKPEVQIVPHYETQYSGASNNSTNTAANANRNYNKSTVITNTTYTGHNLNVTQTTGEKLQEAIKTETEKYNNKINNTNNTNNTTTNTTTSTVEPTHNTGSGGRSFGNTSSGTTSTYNPASSLATSIGTIKSTNTGTKPTTTTTTTTKTTTSDTGMVTGGTATGPSAYQYPTSTAVVGGGSKYPVNKPQIEGSLAQNNVSTTTLGSSGSTHGGGGYSGSGYSFSGSSAVTSDGTIGEQDTKGTLASSITKNKTNKTETIRIAESDEEEVTEEKANNFVIPTSAALSAAAAAGIGAKIIMDKKDKDKEEEQEESDEDYEIISSDFENDFGNDYNDNNNNNEYEVVENY